MNLIKEIDVTLQSLSVWVWSLRQIPKCRRSGKKSSSFKNNNRFCRIHCFWPTKCWKALRTETPFCNWRCQITEKCNNPRNVSQWTVSNWRKAPKNKNIDLSLKFKFKNQMHIFWNWNLFIENAVFVITTAFIRTKDTNWKFSMNEKKLLMIQRLLLWGFNWLLIITLSVNSNLSLVCKLGSKIQTKTFSFLTKEHRNHWYMKVGLRELSTFLWQYCS